MSEQAASAAADPLADGFAAQRRALVLDDERELAELEEQLACHLDDALLAATIGEWSGVRTPTPVGVRRGAAAGDAPLSTADDLPTAELLALAGSVPAGQRAGLLSRVDVTDLTGWQAEELVRLAASAQAAITALQVRARLAVADAYRRLRDEAVEAQQARDAAARAAGERVPPRRPVRDQSVSALMKLENISRVAAEGRLAQARDLALRLPRTLELLEQGEISPDHARLVRTETAGLSDDACGAVETRIQDAFALTPGECAKAARLAAAAVDAEEFERRHAEDRHARTAYVKPLPNGMAMLTAIGPAEHVAMAWLEIDEQARALRTAGDPRTLAQLRCDLVLAAPAPPATGGEVGGTSHVDLRTGEITTHTSSYPPTHPPTHPRTERPGAAQPPPQPPPAPAPQGPPTPGRTFQGRPVTTVLVIGIDSYLGATDVPALIQGVGPVPAAVARELAHGSASWFRAALDDSGVVRDYGRLRAPRQDLRDLVIRGRGIVCACGCGQPATQIDHATEHQHGGRTCEDNLDALATRCHTDKTDAVAHGTGWTPTLTGDGTVVWTSPFGHERRIRLTDLGFTLPPPRIIDPEELEPTRERTYDPGKPYHPILNAPPVRTRGPDPTVLDPDAPPPF